MTPVPRMAACSPCSLLAADAVPGPCVSCSGVPGPDVSDSIVVTDSISVLIRKVHSASPDAVRQGCLQMITDPVSVAVNKTLSASGRRGQHSCPADTQYRCRNQCSCQ